MDKSLQFKTNQTFLDFFVHKLNPQIESFENGITSQIYKSNWIETMDSWDESTGTQFPYTIPTTLLNCHFIMKQHLSQAINFLYLFSIKLFILQIK